MIKHKLIKKGKLAWALVTSISDPNFLIPVKIKIVDVRFHEYNPKYLVKILKFYDNVYIIRDHFINRKFITTLDKNNNASKFLPFSKSFKPKSTADIIDYMDSKDMKILVESVFVVSSKTRMLEMLEILQDYFIMETIQNLKELTARTTYKGQFSVDSNIDFFIKFRSFILSISPKTDKEYKEFIDRFDTFKLRNRFDIHFKD